MKEERDEYGELILSIEDTRKQILKELLDMRRIDATPVTGRVIAIYVKALQAAESPGKDGKLPSVEEIGERLAEAACIHQRVHAALQHVAARYQYEAVKQRRKSSCSNAQSG
jgi:hypothetical protein